MAKRPTILQVVPSLVSGGVERGTIEVAAALIKNGYGALVASSGGPMVKELEQLGVRHITLPLASKNPLVIYANIARLAEIASANEVDIIHARSRAPAWSAYYAARRAKCRFVTTFHNAYGAGNIFKRFYNSGMAKGERVIAISHFVGRYARKLYGVGSEKLRIIPRGVDVAYFDPEKVDASRLEQLKAHWSLKPNLPVILLPGRLTRWKGQLVLVEALAQLPHRNFQCVMIGKADRDYELEVQDLAQKRGLDEQIRIFDTCRDMPAALMLADSVVSPATRPEGFGRVIIEAQAMGRPVIATNHGGANETIIPGETGWLVPPSDAKALAAALQDVLNLTPEQKETLRTKSITHIRAHFTTDKMTEATLAVYNEVIL